MEWHIALTTTGFDPTPVQDLLQDIDPSALAVMNPASDTLRVFAEVDAAQLAGLMAEAGTPVDPAAIKEIPGLCCGGCST